MEATGCRRPFDAVQKYGISSMEFWSAKNEWKIHIFLLSANSILYCQHLASRLHHIQFGWCLSIRFDFFRFKIIRWCALPHINVCCCWYAYSIPTIRTQFNLNPFIIHYWSACHALSASCLLARLQNGSNHQGTQTRDAHRKQRISLVRRSQCVNWEIRMNK